MKRIIWIITSLFGLMTYSQTGTIKGKIIDKQSEKPLSGAIIQIIGLEKMANILNNFRQTINQRIKLLKSL